MGFLTTITIRNDAIHAFRKDPKAFGEAILNGVYKAQETHRQVDVGFDGYANYITINPPRHADDHTLYLHYGNCVHPIDGHNFDFKVRVGSEYIERAIKVARSILKSASDYVKTKAEEAKQNGRSTGTSKVERNA